MPLKFGPAIDALVALARMSAAIGGADVTVYDGPPTNDLPDDYVAVGLDPANDGGAGVDSQVGWAAFGKVRSETDLIYCQASAASGDTDMKTVRDRVSALVEALAVAVLADVTLGGTVIKALVGPAVAYIPEQLPGGESSSGGAVATVNFTVEVLTHI